MLKSGKGEMTMALRGLRKEIKARVRKCSAASARKSAAWQRSEQSVVRAYARLNKVLDAYHAERKSRGLKALESSQVRRLLNFN
jgi:hypothetical protein